MFGNCGASFRRVIRIIQTDTQKLPNASNARAQARALLAGANHAALAWTDPETLTPGISRIGFGLTPEGVPLTLISALAPHVAALRAHPDCAVMLGEVGARGDALTHPRLMLRARAEFCSAIDCRSTLRCC